MCNTSVKTLRNLNNLPGDVIVPGMTLVVPKIDESKHEEQKKKHHTFSLGLLNPFKQKSKKNERSTSAQKTNSAKIKKEIDLNFDGRKSKGATDARGNRASSARRDPNSL